jgi:hypothetical protein
VLLQEDVDKIDKFVRLPETREEKVLLQLLVIILDKFANGLCGIRQWLRRQIFIRVNAPQRFPVNKQDTLQHAMLPHQVFRRRHFLMFLFFLFRKQAPGGANCRSGENNAARSKELSATGLIDRFHRL